MSQVRRNSAVIDLPILQEAMVKIKLGLPEAPLPDRCPHSSAPHPSCNGGNVLCDISRYPIDLPGCHMSPNCGLPLTLHSVTLGPFLGLHQVSSGPNT